MDFVRQVARRLGLRDKAAEHLDRAVETVCRNVIERAFGPDEVGQYDVEILRRPGLVVIAVEDRGLPSITLTFETMGTQLYRRCSTAHSQTRCVSSTSGVAATGWSSSSTCPTPTSGSSSPRTSTAGPSGRPTPRRTPRWRSG